MELELSDGLPEVPLDPSQLRQALLNIVRNAGEALSGEGGGRLVMSTWRARSGDGVLLEVRDDGPGMDPISRLGSALTPTWWFL